MFSVTGNLLVKPRVSERPGDVTWSPHAGVCLIGCCVIDFSLQLFEDVEDALSCTMFEEDSLSRKLNGKPVYIETLTFCFLPDRLRFFFLMYSSFLTAVGLQPGGRLAGSC